MFTKQCYSQTDSDETDMTRRSLLASSLCLLPLTGLWAGSGAAWAQAQDSADIARAKTITGASSWRPPAAAHLAYQVQGKVWGGDTSGSSEIKWKYSAATSGYELDLKISAMLMSFLYASRGVFNPEVGFLPASYREKRIGRDRTVFMNYETGQVTFPWKPQDPRILLPGIQDTTSVIMQMAHLITGDPQKAQVGKRFEFPIARMGSVKLWWFEIMGTPEVEINGVGRYSTWHISRMVPPNDDKSKDLRVEFWLAPELHHLPVQMTFHMGEGTYLQAALSRVRQLVA